MTAFGPRTSLVALVAGVLEPRAIQALQLHDSFGSLKEVIERNLGVDQAPELFCFGLLHAFDIKQMVAMLAPRPAVFVQPSARVAAELGSLRNYSASPAR